MLTKLGQRAEKYSSKFNPWSNLYGVGRTLLATGTFLTLVTNPTYVLFRPAAGIPEAPVCKGVSALSFFCVLEGNLEIARWIAVSILFLVMIGIYPRVTALPHWWITFSLQNSAMIVDGGDQFGAVLTFLLLPVALTDSRRWHWTKPSAEAPKNNTRLLVKRLVAHSALFVIRVQVAIIYFNTAIGKFIVPEWIDGTVVYYWFIEDDLVGVDSWLEPLLIPLLTSNLVSFLTWAVLALELSLGLAILMDKKAQRVLLVLGILFHLSIGFFLGLVSFAFATTSALWLYLGPRRGVTLEQVKKLFGEQYSDGEVSTPQKDFRGVGQGNKS